MAYYESLGSIVSIAVILPMLDILAVALRFVSRKRQRIPFEADDWLALAATVLVVGLGITLVYGSALHGLGHATIEPSTSPQLAATSSLTVSTPQAMVASKMLYVFMVISVPALGFTKLCFLCSYRRIFCLNRQKSVFYTVLLAAITLVSAWTIAFFFTFLFACRGNFAAWWQSEVSLITNCPNSVMKMHGLSVSDFLTDVIIVLLPIPMVWKLQMPTRCKIEVCAVFLLGLVSVGASLARMVMAIHGFVAGFDSSTDEDLYITGQLYWSMVESGIGLFAACLPVLRALVKDFVIPAIKRLRSLVFGSSISSKHSRLPEHITDRRQALDDELIKESKTSSSGVAESHCEDVEAYAMDFVMQKQ